ncbi:putative receptor-like protein kinase [Iris pallida]|uniref:Receptor-like protein kinase n=1 Tax=Iris pallida TaxID=29817 RepID=A0AAX6IHU9_IRIPA|nr:putative receptor-like protein kinase [Iris pallida]
MLPKISSQQTGPRTPPSAPGLRRLQPPSAEGRLPQSPYKASSPPTSPSSLHSISPTTPSPTPSPTPWAASPARNAPSQPEPLSGPIHPSYSTCLHLSIFTDL